MSATRERDRQAYRAEFARHYATPASTADALAVYADTFAAGCAHARRQIVADLRDEAGAARRLGRHEEADNLERLAGRYERGEHATAPVTYCACSAPSCERCHP